MADTEITTVERSPGLPPDGDGHHYFGFDQGGNLFGLQWAPEHGCWSGVGFVNGWPTTRLFRGDAANAIVSSLKSPLSDIPSVKMDVPPPSGGIMSKVFGSDTPRS